MTNKVLHAFPSPSVFTQDGDTLESGYNGMTLRDYFAAKFVPMAIEHWRNCDKNEPDGGVFQWSTEIDDDDDCMPAAELAYRMADAMMVARELPDNAMYTVKPAI